MNPRRGCGWGRRVRAHVDARGRVAGRRADHDMARVLADDAAVLPDDVTTVAHLHGAHHSLLEVEVQRAAHRQLVLDHLIHAIRGVCKENCTLTGIIIIYTYYRLFLSLFSVKSFFNPY